MDVRLEEEKEEEGCGKGGRPVSGQRQTWL
jgi:hypothetical protein